MAFGAVALGRNLPIDRRTISRRDWRGARSYGLRRGGHFPGADTRTTVHRCRRSLLLPPRRGAAHIVLGGGQLTRGKSDSAPFIVGGGEVSVNVET